MLGISGRWIRRCYSVKWSNVAGSILAGVTSFRKPVPAFCSLRKDLLTLRVIMSLVLARINQITTGVHPDEN